MGKKKDKNNDDNDNHEIVCVLRSLEDTSDPSFLFL